jgi:hypothetical protein
VAFALATLDKSNDAIEGVEVSFRFHTVELSRDEDGTSTTAPVIVPAETPAQVQTTSRPRITANQQSMLNILDDAVPHGLTLEEWNKKARDIGIGRQRPATHYDIRCKLRAKGLVHDHMDRWYVTHR